MIRSMTGFGRGQARYGKGTIVVEIKTVNHKYFDVSLKIPEGLAAFEDRIKELLQRKVQRGKISMSLMCKGPLARNCRVSVNKRVAGLYRKELAVLGRSFGLKDDISVRDLMTLPGILTYESTGADSPKMWHALKRAIEDALGKLVEDRNKEGAALHKDLEKRVRNIERMLAAIRKRASVTIEEYRKKFAERVKDFASGRTIDPGRLEIEVAIYAKNCDISEEIARLASHLANFKKTTGGSGDIGKKLDFIAQELHREINTIGSKSSDFRVSKNVIEMKGEVEKIREQAKNVE